MLVREPICLHLVWLVLVHDLDLEGPNHLGEELVYLNLLITHQKLYLDKQKTKEDNSENIPKRCCDPHTFWVRCRQTSCYKTRAAWLWLHSQATSLA